MNISSAEKMILQVQKMAIRSPHEKDCWPSKIKTTRMHSSRMRTVRSSSRRGDLHQATPLGPCTTPPPGTMHPPGTMPPRDHAPPVDRHTNVNILPCPKLRLRAVKILPTFFGLSNRILERLIVPLDEIVTFPVQKYSVLLTRQKFDAMTSFDPRDILPRR